MHNKTKERKLDLPVLILLKRADQISAQVSTEYLNSLVPDSTVTISRLKEDRYGRTIAELSKGPINIQEQLVEKGFARIYERYASQCERSKKKI